MPYKMLKTKNGYGVKNTTTGKWHSKNTTKAKASRQLKLLNAVEHGYKPK